MMVNWTQVYGARSLAVAPTTFLNPSSTSASAPYCSSKDIPDDLRSGRVTNRNYYTASTLP